MTLPVQHDTGYTTPGRLETNCQWPGDMLSRRTCTVEALFNPLFYPQPDITSTNSPVSENFQQSATTRTKDTVMYTIPNTQSRTIYIDNPTQIHSCRCSVKFSCAGSDKRETGPMRVQETGHVTVINQWPCRLWPCEFRLLDNFL